MISNNGKVLRFFKKMKLQLCFFCKNFSSCFFLKTTSFKLLDKITGCLNISLSNQHNVYILVIFVSQESFQLFVKYLKCGILEPGLWTVELKQSGLEKAFAYRQDIFLTSSLGPPVGKFLNCVCILC